MINGITNFLTSSTLSNIAQSTTASVSIETGMKAVGRPSFILADKKLDNNTKKYAATKEFLYQATCLATYMAIIIPIFKKGAFKLAKNKIMKNEAGFNMFKNANEYLDYKKLASLSKESRMEALSSKKYKDLFTKEIKEELSTKDKPEQYDMIKGVIEFGNIVGSVLGLAIFAPQVSHMIVHPVMKFLGMEKPEAKEHK